MLRPFSFCVFICKDSDIYGIIAIIFRKFIKLAAYFEKNLFFRSICTIFALTMKRAVVFGMLCMTLLLLSSCSQRGKAVSSDTASVDSLLCPKYAVGYQVKSQNGMRLVDVGHDYHFALVTSDDMMVPDGYTKIRIPIKSTICMTALQLSNFTILDAHDVVKGLTSTKNLFNKDILQRVKNGRIVKIGSEGNFDTEMVLAANPDVIFISPFKRGGYDAIKETGITLVPHLGYKELDPLGQAEWIKFVGMFIGKEKEACVVFAGIEKRYNE
jgi:iron complex transport system substrate-binding protein